MADDPEPTLEPISIAEALDIVLEEDADIIEALKDR